MFRGQALLDEITGAVMADDFDRYLRHTAVPFVIVSPSGTRVLDGVEKLRLGFDRAVEMYRALKVTDVVRRLKEQHPVGSSLMALHYEVHVLRGADRLYPPYPQASVARREGEGWKVGMLACSLLNEEWPIVVPQPEGALV